MLFGLVDTVNSKNLHHFLPGLLERSLALGR
jgi:hypothetical protein